MHHLTTQNTQNGISLEKSQHYLIHLAYWFHSLFWAKILLQEMWTAGLEWDEEMNYPIDQFSALLIQRASRSKTSTVMSKDHRENNRESVITYICQCL